MRRIFASTIAAAAILAGCSTDNPARDADNARAAADAPDGGTGGPEQPAVGGTQASADGTAGAVSSAPGGGAPTGATLGGERPVQDSTAATPSSPSGAVTLTPRTGTFTYRTTGYSESGTGPTTRRRSMPQATTDTVTQGNDGTVEVVTDFGDGSSQHALLQIDGSDVHLLRLAFASTSNGVKTEQAISPSPPILLYRSPFAIGDRWESSWEDRAYGVQGVGTGAVLRTEPVETPLGRFNTAVVHLDHRIRGSVTGRLQATLWIDPATATRARDETILDLTVGTTPSHTEYRRTLTSASAS